MFRFKNPVSGHVLYDQMLMDVNSIGLYGLRQNRMVNCAEPNYRACAACSARRALYLTYRSVAPKSSPCYTTTYANPEDRETGLNPGQNSAIKHDQQRYLNACEYMGPNYVATTVIPDQLPSSRRPGVAKYDEATALLPLPASSGTRLSP